MASSPSALPWLWIIEALARFKQVDASVLKELVKRTPEITGDLEKDVTEIVSFRVLDTLVSERDRTNGSASPAPVSENKLAPSECCENVVLSMLLERKDEAEMLPSEVQNFTTRKRVSLPKCTLQKLKDAILEGKQPALASLKEKSGLSSSNKSGERTAMNDVNPNEATGLCDIRTVAGGENLTSPNVENSNGLSQNDCRNRNLTPSKRDTSYLESENQALRSHIDTSSLVHDSDTHLQITKNFKHDDSLIGPVVGHEPLPAVRDEQPEALVDELDLELDLPAVRDKQPEAFIDSSDTLLQITKKLKHDVSLTGVVVGNEPLLAVRYEQPEASVDKLDLVFSDKETKDDRRSCAEIGKSNVAPLNRAHESICAEANPNMEKSQRIPFNVELYHGTHSNNLSHEAERDKNHNPDREYSSDSDGYQDERIDIATRKFNFLSSQCTFTQDSLATANCSELNFCTKCEKGGELLVCSATDCPIVVHQSCLDTAPSFDFNGKFFCPFCSYSRAIQEYHKIKKKVFFVRKDLAVFLGSEKGHRLKQIVNECSRPEQKQRRQDDDLHINDQKHQSHVNDAINSENRSNIGNAQQAESSISEGNPPVRLEIVEKFGKPEQNQQRQDVNVNGKGQKHQYHVNDAINTVDRENIGKAQPAEPSTSYSNPLLRLDIVKKLSMPEYNQQIQDGNVNRKDQNHVNDAISTENMENIGDTQQAEPSTSNGSPPIRVEDDFLDDRIVFASKESNREGGKLVPECQRDTALGIKEVEEQASQDRGNNNSLCRDRAIVPMTKKLGPKQDSCRSNVDMAKQGEEEYGPFSDYIMRTRKEKTQFTYSATPRSRRKKMEWTSEEEEVLKEGVKIFTGAHDKTIQWTTILEFGSPVFQKGRTAVDLKDKWRNICKRRIK